MPAGRSGNWIDRLSDSLRDHEQSRVELRPTLPRYEILAELGRGGMGVVYRAWDPQLGREVALKVLLDQGSGSAEARERLLREAQVAARLSHPHIVPVYDTGEWMGQAYLAMQIVEGTTLDKAGLEPRALVAALRDAARALEHAHRQGIIHRDVKPANLMVDRSGHVWVTDFGLARRHDVPTHLTLSGVILGTPAYMSPEQAQNEPLDARSDIYALGATMYDLLTGTAPFLGADAISILLKVASQEPPTPRTHNPRLPRDLETVILKAMDRDPARRYASAGDLADDLQHFLEGEPVQARRHGFLTRAHRLARRHRWLAPAAAVAFVAAIGLWTLLPARDPELEKLDALIQRQEIPPAEALLADLRARRPSDPRVAARGEAVRTLVARELDRAFDRLGLRLVAEDVEGASKILAELEARPDFEHASRARQLLEETRRAGAEIDRRMKAAGTLLAARDVAATWKEVDALSRLSIPGLPGGTLARARTSAEYLRSSIQAQEALQKLTQEESLPALYQVAVDAFQNRSLPLLSRAVQDYGDLSSRAGTEETRKNVSDLRQALDCLKRMDGLAPVPDPGQLSEIARELSTLPERLRTPALAYLDERRRKAEAAEAEALLQGVLQLCRERRLDPALEKLRKAESFQPAPPGLEEARRQVRFLQDRASEIRRTLSELRRDGRLLEEREKVEKLRKDAPASADLEALLAETDRELETLAEIAELARRANLLDQAGFIQRLKALSLPEADRPRAAGPLLLMGRNLREAGELEAAAVWLGKALEYDPASWEALAERGMARRDLGRAAEAADDWAKASALLDGALQKGPPAPRLLLERGRLFRRRGLYEKAAEDAERPELKDLPEALLLLGEARFVAARTGGGGDALKRALEAFERAADRAPQDARALYGRGTCRHLLNAPGALEDLDRSVALGFKGPDAPLQAARLRVDRERFKEALEPAGQALERIRSLTEIETVLLLAEHQGTPPASVRARLRSDAHSVRARARFETGDLDGCVQDCEEILKEDARHAGAHFRLGYAWYMKGKYDLSIAAFGRAVEINPRDTEALIGQGRARTQKGDYEAAIDDLNRAIRLNAASPEAHAARGDAYRRQGQVEAARRDYQKAFDLAPAKSPLRAALLELLRKL
jgi:tetratricopeptide (TPR) repeat protein